MWVKDPWDTNRIIDTGMERMERKNALINLYSHIALSKFNLYLKYYISILPKKIFKACFRKLTRSLRVFDLF